jgi:YggT family protein
MDFIDFPVVGTAILILGITLGIMSFLFVFRIILTWYPQIELKRLPWVIVYWPTEPFLAPTRKLIPPIGGVDITPIVWFGIITLIRELAIGQQGILRML